MLRNRVMLGVLAGLLAWSGPLVADDEAVIQALLEAKEAAWTAGDGAGWAQDYQADSVLVNLAGTRFEGREENARRHAEVLAGPFAGTTLKVAVERVAMLGANRALAEARLTVSGIDTMPEGLPDAGDGTLNTRMSFLLEQDADRGWQIRFAQNTAVLRP